jgi:hypothetical protein
MMFPFEYEGQYRLRKQEGSERKVVVNPSAHADGTDLMFAEKANEESKKSLTRRLERNRPGCLFGLRIPRLQARTLALQSVEIERYRLG